MDMVRVSVRVRYAVRLGLEQVIQLKSELAQFSTSEMMPGSPSSVSHNDSSQRPSHSRAMSPRDTKLMNHEQQFKQSDHD